MALQGNLRDFAASEILQLVGSQKKSGCLTLEWNTEKAVIYVNEGRIVSTRVPGMAKDDPLLAFLLSVRRLSEDQHRGILAIQKESNRDLEDILLNGRYLDAQELATFLERQILDDLMRLVRWDNGSYRFDPHAKWPQPPVVLMSMEGAMIEAARRVDEQKRFVQLFRDPHVLLGVRDLPDPDEPLTEEERDLFGIIDGQRTVSEVVDLAPLSEYEAYEALQRMMDSQWVEVVGRRNPGGATPAPAPPPVRAHHHRSVFSEVAFAVAVIAAVLVLRLASGLLARPSSPVAAEQDVFATAQIRDLDHALGLYHRETGAFPEKIDELVVDRWISADQVRMTGYELLYRREPSGDAYQLELRPVR